MATNKPETRKTHITRIFGTNRRGDLLDDIWADVERIDISKGRTQTADGVSQGLQRKYRWHDDPNGEDYTEEDADDRNTIVVKVCDPTSGNVDDPDEWIPIRVKKSVRASGGDGNGQRYQERLRNDNDEENLARVVVARRILHYDTSIDGDAQAAADAGFKAYVVDSDQYDKDTASKDDGQYVEHEIIKFFKSRNANNHVQADEGADVDSGLQVKLLNEYLIDESEEPDGDVVGKSGINPPYRLDPYQNIVNISFGGLAVEFQDESYVELPGSTVVPDTRKATMSFWFRVESASIAAASAEIAAWQDSGGPRPLLCGVVPLVVMGPAGQVEDIDFEQVVVGEFPGGCAMYCACPGTWAVASTIGGFPACSPPSSVFESIGVLNGAFKDCDPSYIGVDCSGDYPMFSINLITPYDNKATGSFPAVVSQEFSGDFNSYASNTAVCTPDGLIQCAPGVQVPPPFADQGQFCTERFSWTSNTIEYGEGNGAGMLRRNETFRLLPQARIGESVFGDAADQQYKGIRIIPDHWHHVVLSFDLTSPCITKGQLVDFEADVPDPRPTVGGRTSGAPKIYVALDDVNYTGSDLSAYYPKGYGDLNAVCSVNGFNIACQVSFEGSQDLTVVAGVSYPCQGGLDEIVQTGILPTYRLKPQPLELSAAPVGLPASGQFSSGVKHVEMAVFQMFTDIALDTASAKVRRAFITGEGKPAPIGDVEKAIGKPEVLLTPAHNLRTGRNVGTLASDPPDKGTAVGDPKNYKPNPTLYGDQS